MTSPHAVDAAAGPLIDRFSGLVCDLDGVVYHGREPVPDAVPALNEVAERRRVVYATNNASRTPEQVIEQLRALGLSPETADVVTSAVAGAQLLAQELGAGHREVLTIGGQGVHEAVVAAGLVPIAADAAAAADAPRPAAVLQGYGAQVTAADLAEAAYAIQDGARWVATNDDRTLPTDRGIAPGNGTLVAAVAAASPQPPTVVGKPGPLMYEMSAALLGVPVGEVLGIGDRLETDVAGANAAGMPSALVLTGVHGPGDAAAAPAASRPDLVLGTLAELSRPYAQPERAGDTSWRCGDAMAEVRSGRLEVTGGSRLERVRALLGLAWELVDEGGLDPDGARAQVDELTAP